MEKVFIWEKDKEEFRPDDLSEYITRHQEVLEKYLELDRLYKGQHKILSEENKPIGKPDNRLVVNYAKYIVDTLNGFFMGIPVRVTSDDESVTDFIKALEVRNNLDDNNSDLSKKSSIYGHAFELLFIDEDSQVGITHIDPKEAFIIYDNSIRQKKLFGIRYQMTEDKIQGTISDDEWIRYFSIEDEKVTIQEERPHYFKEVPMIEYVENEERMGAFEPVITLIDAYNKAVSEKANDVDYFADAYMKILGAEFDSDTIEKLRDNRVINVWDKNGLNEVNKIVVEFMEKPNADETQENLINRLEKLIFNISMVANINDKNFGTESGISLKYKLLSMMNLANTKERKFAKGFNERFMMISNLPNSAIRPDDLYSLEFKFSRNIPQNTKEEAEIARGLQGILSDETIIDNLSIVGDTKQELERLEEESGYSPAYDYDFIDEAIDETDE